MVFVAGVLSSFACIFYTLAAVYVHSLSQRWQAQYAGGGSAPSGSGP